MFQIKYTKLAIKDLNDSYDYIYQHNQIAGNEVVTKIELTISKLAEYPLLGHKGRVDNTFEVIVPQSSFIVVYIFIFFYYIL